MINLKAKKREKTKRDGKIIPAVLYGPKIETEKIEINLKEFKSIYKEAGESTLLNLSIEKDKFLVLIHDVSLAPVSNEPIHVDFYQPILNKKVEVEVPIIFVGESPAVKNLGGTLVKEIHEIEVSAFPEKLPHEIIVDISGLTDFEKEITVKDLKVKEDVQFLRDPEDMVANVQPPQNIDEELEKPAEEENVESVEKIKKEKHKEDEGI